MKKIRIDYGRKSILVQLSDQEWSALARFINNNSNDLFEDARVNVDKAISEYLTCSFNDRQVINPKEFSVPFERMVKLSGDLLSMIDEYLFPFDPNNREFDYDQLVKGRIRHSKIKKGQILIKRKSNNKKNGDKVDIDEKNEAIRRAMVQWIEAASRRELMEDADLVLIRKNAYEINLLFKAAVSVLPSAKGDHGDPHILELIARVMIIYQSAGGKGYTSRDAAFPFMELLMEYVAELARVHIDDDHAIRLKHKTSGPQLEAQIKEARRRKWLWE